MYKLVHFQWNHAVLLMKEEFNKKVVDDFKRREDFDHSYTLLFNDEPVVCGGVLPYWRGRGHVWMLFSANAKYHMVKITRLVREFVATVNPYNRLEMDVPVNFPKASRRAEMFGFRFDTMARKYLPNGEDRHIFVWVRE